MCFSSYLFFFLFDTVCCTVKKCRTALKALAGNPSQRYGASPAIWRSHCVTCLPPDAGECSTARHTCREVREVSVGVVYRPIQCTSHQDGLSGSQKIEGGVVWSWASEVCCEYSCVMRMTQQRTRRWIISTWVGIAFDVARPSHSSKASR